MAQTKTVNGTELPASAFLYVPDSEDPGTWKLPVKDANGEPNLGRVAAAAAALSPKGFRGSRVDIPADEIGAVKKKLVALYKRLGRDKKEIPQHLLESKSLDECPDGACPVSAASIGGSVTSISEVEYKGSRGLQIDAVMNSLGRDFYDDWALLTPELKASTDKYFNDYPVAMVQHGRAYRSKDGSEVLPPVRHIIGFTIDHSYEDDGIHIRDFVPEPDSRAAGRVQSAYKEIKNGEFDGISVGGLFYRDTGLHQPPGLIIDWDLFEHSYCRNCVDQDATIIDVTELKAMGDAEAETLWDTMSQGTIHETLAAEYAELKAHLASDPGPAPVSDLVPDPDPAPVSDLVSDPDPVPAAPLLPPEPEALSGMDLYRSNHTLPTIQSRAGTASGLPATVSASTSKPAITSGGPSGHSGPGRIQSDQYLATGAYRSAPILPVSPLKQPVTSAPTPEHKAIPNPIPTTKYAVDPSPAIPFGGNMNDIVQPSGQSATESNDLLQQLLSRVESMEAEKKALELEAINKQRDEEARRTAEERARQVAEQAAQAEAELKSKTDQYFNEALARYQIKPIGAQFSMPVNAGTQSGHSAAVNALVSPWPGWSLKRKAASTLKATKCPST
jgi:hypothetical protein